MAAHLFQVGSIKVSPGMIWATCHFNLHKGEHQSQWKVGGIPNDRALQMQRVVADATADILATFIATSTPGLEAWLEGALSKLKPEPGRNDYGKSTILEALAIFFESGDVKADMSEMNGFRQSIFNCGRFRFF
ncbi:hypothetical protein FQZ97_921860 [compost metagenome]